jgi:excisionase family DNA binding protein
MTEVADVLTTEEAAGFLRRSTKTVLALARSGDLPGNKVGRAWRFLRVDLAAYFHGEQPRGETLVVNR